MEVKDDFIVGGAGSDKKLPRYAVDIHGLHHDIVRHLEPGTTFIEVFPLFLEAQ